MCIHDVTIFLEPEIRGEIEDRYPNRGRYVVFAGAFGLFTRRLYLFLYRTDSELLHKYVRYGLGNEVRALCLLLTHETLHCVLFKIAGRSASYMFDLVDEGFQISKANICE
jgi:hypothetical protein